MDPAAAAKGKEDARAQDSVGPSHMLGSTYENPLGRASMARPTPVQLQRASVVRAAGNPLEPLYMPACTINCCMPLWL